MRQACAKAVWSQQDGRSREDAAWRLEGEGRCPCCASRLEEVIQVSSARCDCVSRGEMQKDGVCAPDFLSPMRSLLGPLRSRLLQGERGLLKIGTNEYLGSRGDASAPMWDWRTG